MTFSLKDLLDVIVCPKKNWKTTLLCKWQEIIGDLHSKVRIEKIYDETIVLGVFHSCWIQELSILSPLIIKTINEKLEQPHIKQIRFKHINDKKKIEKKNKTEWHKKKEVHLSKQDEYTLAKIADPSLREALKAFRIRCYQEAK